jgi:hypothetical protein
MNLYNKHCESRRSRAEAIPKIYRVIRGLLPRQCKIYASNLVYIIIISLLFISPTIYSQQTDSLQLNYNYINSTPQNAEVYLNNEYIGSTPTRFLDNIIDSLNRNKVDIKLKYYFDYSFTFDKTELPINKNIMLVPLSKKISGNIVLKNYSNYFKPNRKVIPIILSGAISLGSAVTSFYFKRLANENYDQYVNNGDRSTLDRTRKYDIYSGIGLGIMETAFVSFLYFLLIQ